MIPHHLRVVIDRLIRATSHATTCAFSGCTCGATDELSEARTDALRAIRADEGVPVDMREP